MLRAGEGIEVIADIVYEWTHPHPDHWLETITSATKASAARAAEMATMARASSWRSLPRSTPEIEDRGDRLAIKHAYFDRLVRSDISCP